LFQQTKVINLKQKIMSHFTVLVISDNVEEQLQPYHEYECTGTEDEYVVFVPAKETEEELQAKFEENKEDYKSFEQFMSDWYGYRQNEEGVWGNKTNPNSKWDWYTVGGRWSGFFKTKEGVEGLLGRPGVFGNEPQEGGADIIRKGDVDWEGMREEAGVEAAKKWDVVNEGIKDTPEHESWESIRERMKDEIDEAREIYHNQERVKAFKEVCNKHQDLFGWFSSVEEYLCDKETYVERAKNSSITTYAVVKDGVWYQKGSMGWWGMSSDEMSQDEWNQKYWELIQSVPDDEILTLVDCHI
jgi:hypothetical protein